MECNVTHYFGHSGDVSTVMCSGSHKDLLPEKSDCCLPLQNIFLSEFAGCIYCAGCENPDSRRLLYTWIARGSQFSL
jgi:hypothetical protein